MHLVLSSKNWYLHSEYIIIFLRGSFFMIRRFLIVTGLLVTFGSSFFGVSTMSEAEVKKSPSGLQYEDVLVGTGAEAKHGQNVSVHYTGWIYKDGKKGNKFDSSVDRGEPFSFGLGMGEVIKGWDEGVAGMKLGGKRTLIIPPELGYGAGGYPPVIPANATLMFDVELLGVK